MSCIEIKNVTIPNGETLFYREVGSGNKVLVLLHGNRNSSVNWDLLMENIPCNQYRAIALDIRGFGRSTYNNPINSIKDLSEDLKMFVDMLNISKFVVIGWSAGGAIALQFAADYPHYVEKYISMAGASIKGYPVPKMNEKGQFVIGELSKTKEDLIPILKPMMDAYEKKDRIFLKAALDQALYIINKPEKERYELYIDEMIMQRNMIDMTYAIMNFNISHDFNGLVEGTGEVDNIKAPVLIIQGDKDIAITMDMAKTNNKGLEKSKLVVLENCGHSPIVDKLEEVMELIRNFTL